MNKKKILIICGVILLVICIFLILEYFYLKNKANINQPSNTDSIGYSKQENTVYDETFIKDIFRATEIISSDDVAFPWTIEFWTEASCVSGDKYEYIAPVGYAIESCEEGEIGSHGGCPTCIMSKVSLYQSRMVHDGIPSSITSAEKTNNIFIGYENYNSSSVSYWDCSNNAIVDYNEDDGAGLFSYYNHWGGGYGTQVNFKENYDMEYVGIKISKGEELIDDFYVDFTGGFSFKSSENDFNVGLLERIIPVAHACSFVDYRGGGGLYNISSRLKFVKKEKGVNWYVPEEKISVNPDINNIQISFYKKDGTEGKVMMALNNIIFKKDDKYFYPNTVEINEENYYDNYALQCLYGDFYYGVFPKEETGSISFDYYQGYSKGMFSIILTNLGDEEITIDQASIEAIPIQSLEVFNGEDINSNNSVFKLDMGLSSDFSNEIIDRKIWPKDHITVSYDVDVTDKKTISVGIVKKDIPDNDLDYKKTYWTIGNPFIFNDGTRIKID